VIPVYQTKFGPKTGNCWPATIASILEIPQYRLDEIPNFCAIYGSRWDEKSNEWLMQHYGVYFLSYTAGKAIDAETNKVIETSIYGPKGFHGISGIGPRGVWHSCVGYAGEIVHDPYPGSTGMTDIRMYDLFIPLDLVQGMGRK
jgi:hypothetical protein